MPELASLFRTCLAVAAIMLPAAVQAQGAPPKAFEVCAACHTGQANALGPDLRGVVGRKVGTLPGYRYSRAMSTSGLTWTPDMLRDYLMKPQQVLPGNRMPLAPLASADATAVAKYLATLK